MKELIQTLIPIIETELTYLKWVKAIDNILLPPEGVDYPGVGIKDGDTVLESRPGKKDIRIDTLYIVPFQSLTYGDSATAIMGEPSLGDEGTGLVDIAEALRTLLNDNLLGDSVLYAHVDRIAASETIASGEGEQLLQYKQVQLTYRSYVS